MVRVHCGPYKKDSDICYYPFYFVVVGGEPHFGSSARWLSEFADGRNLTSPDSEQIEYIVAKQLVRNSVSVEQIQDRAKCFCGCAISTLAKHVDPLNATEQDSPLRPILKKTP